MPVIKVCNPVATAKLLKRQLVATKSLRSQNMLLGSMHELA